MKGLSYRNLKPDAFCWMLEKQPEKPAVLTKGRVVASYPHGDKFLIWAEAVETASPDIAGTMRCGMGADYLCEIFSSSPETDRLAGLLSDQSRHFLPGQDSPSVRRTVLRKEGS